MRTGPRQFAVVGAGLVGLSVTRELARRGRDVVCLEQATIGHERSGSKGSGRLFRHGYADPLYVHMAMRSLGGWKELSEEAGTQLLRPTGLLSLGAKLEELAAAMAEAGVVSEILQGEELAERCPAVQARGPALYEATAGVLAAEEILQALAASGRSAGAEILEAAGVEALEAGGDGVRLELAGGTVLCEVAICCGGPFSGVLAASARLPSASLFRPTLQQVAYLRPVSGELGGVPAFVERGEVTTYGLPVLEAGLYKLGIHDPSGVVDPTLVALEDDPVALQLLRATARRLLPGLDPEPVATERCFYDNTPNEDFVMDRLGRVVIGGGSSGHGFKFGPVWGEVLADLAEGKTPSWPLRRFALRR